MLTAVVGRWMLGESINSILEEREEHLEEIKVNPVKRKLIKHAQRLREWSSPEWLIGESWKAHSKLDVWVSLDFQWQGGDEGQEPRSHALNELLPFGCAGDEDQVFAENKFLAGHCGRCFTYVVALISHHTLQGRSYDKKTEGQRGLITVQVHMISSRPRIWTPVYLIIKSICYFHLIPMK